MMSAIKPQMKTLLLALKTFIFIGPLKTSFCNGTISRLFLRFINKTENVMSKYRVGRKSRTKKLRGV